MKIIFCMLALFLLTSCASQSKPSVQSISSKSAFTLEFATHYCSATAISSNVILSAGHCFLSDEAVTFKIDGREAKVIKIARDGKDHVLVMVNIAFSQKAAIASNKLTEGGEVYYFGNPGMKHIYRTGQYVGMHNESMVFDVNAWHGDSGAAVFDENGKIVAVVNAIMNLDIFKLTICYPLAFTDEQYKSFGVVI